MSNLVLSVKMMGQNKRGRKRHKICMLNWLAFFLFHALSVSGQELTLPRHLSDLTAPGVFVRWHGLEFSDFTVQEEGVIGLAASVNVAGSDLGVFHGLSFHPENGALNIASTINSKGLNVTYSVRNVASSSLIHAAELAVDGTVTGNGLVGAGVGFSDIGSIPPIATSLGSTSVAISRFLSDADKRKVKALLASTSRLGVAGGIHATTYALTDSASATGVYHRYELESDIRAGDYDFDGDVDAADYSIWRRQFGSAGDRESDGNRNGIIDAGDYVIWRKNANAVPGDYNKDGMVNGADYSVWRGGFGTNNPAADGNGNGAVDAADYVIWRKSLLLGSSSAFAVIPEPGALSLLCIGFGPTWLFRRGRR